MVRIKAVDTDPLAGSSDVKLLVKIPGDLDVVPEGSLVTLEADSGFGSDSVPILVGRPSAQQVEGKLHVFWQSITSANPREVGDPLSRPLGPQRPCQRRVHCRSARVARIRCRR